MERLLPFWWVIFENSEGFTETGCRNSGAAGLEMMILHTKQNLLYLAILNIVFINSFNYSSLGSTVIFY